MRLGKDLSASIFKGTIGRIIRMHDDGLLHSFSQNPATPFRTINGRLLNVFSKGDNEWWQVWHLIECKDEETAEYIYRLHVGPLEGWNARHAGQAFSRDVYIKQVGVNRFLAYQSGGLDV